MSIYNTLSSYMTYGRALYLRENREGTAPSYNVPYDSIYYKIFIPIEYKHAYILYT